MTKTKQAKSENPSDAPKTKKKNSRKVVIVFLIFVVIITSVAMKCSDTFYHEKAHQRIFEEYGGNSTIELYWFGLAGGMTTPTSPVPDSDSLRALQAANEVYGYTLSTIISDIMMFNLVTIVVIFFLAFDPEKRRR